MEREQAISVLVNEALERMDSGDIASYFVQEQTKYYNTYSNEQLETALSEECGIEESIIGVESIKHPKILCVSVIRDGVIERITAFHEDEVQEAGERFLFECSQILSNWDEYTKEDMEAILDQGYEKFGNGSICLTWTEEN